MSDPTKKLGELIATNLETLNTLDQISYEDPNRCWCPYCEEDEILYMIWAHEQEEAYREFVREQWEEEETTKENTK